MFPMFPNTSSGSSQTRSQLQHLAAAIASGEELGEIVQVVTAPSQVPASNVITMATPPLVMAPNVTMATTPLRAPGPSTIPIHYSVMGPSTSTTRPVFPPATFASFAGPSSTTGPVFPPANNNIDSFATMTRPLMSTSTGIAAYQPSYSQAMLSTASANAMHVPHVHQQLQGELPNIHNNNMMGGDINPSDPPHFLAFIVLWGNQLGLSLTHHHHIDTMHPPHIGAGGAPTRPSGGDPMRAQHVLISMGQGVAVNTADSHTSAPSVKKEAILPIIAGSPWPIENRVDFIHKSICHCIDAKVCVSHMYNTPVQLSAMLPLLDCYPDLQASSLLREGFSSGFRLQYSGSRLGRDADNLKSALKDPELVKEKILKEVRLGRIAGPFSASPIHDLIVSPVGLVPKAEPGKFRLIHHLSYPEGGSINDGIDRDACRVQYTRFDVAVGLVMQVGRGALMAKADIESAFRLLPIHPGDFQLLGIRVGPLFYIDKALPMGASCSPAYFEAFSTFLEWVAKKESGSDLICHYMDDFFFVGGPLGGGGHLTSCHQLVASFERICKKFGVPLAKDKSVGPLSKLVFLGLEIDAVNQVVSVPAAKLVRIVNKVNDAIALDALSLRALQSLIGSLSFICRAITPGRAFLRRLIDLTIGIHRPWQKICVSTGAKSDLLMWKIFLHDFNGSAMISDQFWSEDQDIQLFTDASGGIGFGGFLQGRWFHDHWPPGLDSSNHSIAWMEFFPIVVAMVLWGDRMSRKKIIIRSDNESVVAIVNKQSSKCPLIMKLVRFFVLQCLKCNVAFKAIHIPGVRNNIADSLSRFQMSRFRSLAPDAKPVGCPVPRFLWKI